MKVIVLEDSTVQQLTTIQFLYDMVFDRLLAVSQIDFYGKEHRELIKIEQELNEYEIRLRKKLGIYTYDPCPVGSFRQCHECIGLIERTFLKFGKTGKRLFKMSLVSSGGVKCKLKDLTFNKKYKGDK